MKKTNYGGTILERLAKQDKRIEALEKKIEAIEKEKEAWNRVFVNNGEEATQS